MNIEILKTAISLLQMYNTVVNNPQVELSKKIDISFNAKIESGVKLLENGLLIKDKYVQKNIIIHAVDKLHEASSIYKSLIIEDDNRIRWNWFKTANGISKFYCTIHSLLSSYIFINKAISKCNQALFINDNRSNEIDFAIKRYAKSFFQDKFLGDYEYLSNFIEMNYIQDLGNDRYEYNTSFKSKFIIFMEKHTDFQKILYIKKRFRLYDLEYHPDENSLPFNDHMDDARYFSNQSFKMLMQITQKN